MTCVKSVHVYENECLLYVGALLGVWGIVPVCVPGWLMRVICCGGVCLLVGVLCENCIVDASICMMPLVWWCCVCDVIFSCVFILSSSFFAAVCGLHGFLLCWLCGVCVVVGVFVF